MCRGSHAMRGYDSSWLLGRLADRMWGTVNSNINQSCCKMFLGWGFCLFLSLVNNVDVVVGIVAVLLLLSSHSRIPKDVGWSHSNTCNLTCTVKVVVMMSLGSFPIALCSFSGKCLCHYILQPLGSNCSSKPRFYPSPQTLLPLNRRWRKCCLTAKSNKVISCRFL